jgi:hypothetical protein
LEGADADESLEGAGAEHPKTRHEHARTSIAAIILRDIVFMAPSILRLRRCILIAHFIEY